MSTFTAAQIEAHNQRVATEEAAARAHAGKPPIQQQLLPEAQPAPITEERQKWQKREERKMHDDFMKWLNLHQAELVYDHSRMDKPTTNRTGWPDFSVVRGTRICLIEMKCPGFKPTAVQLDVHAWIAKTGGKVHVCYSTTEAIETVKREMFNEPNEDILRAQIVSMAEQRDKAQEYAALCRVQFEKASMAADRFQKQLIAIESERSLERQVFPGIAEQIEETIEDQKS